MRLDKKGREQLTRALIKAAEDAVPPDRVTVDVRTDPTAPARLDVAITVTPQEIDEGSLRDRIGRAIRRRLGEIE